MPRKKTQEEFVNELKQTHPNLKVVGEYIGDKEYVNVHCTIHNYTFPTKPNWLHHGSNCKKCYNDRRGEKLRKPIEKLRQEMSERHNGRYAYPKLEEEYRSNKSVITIVCPLHGEFPQTINHHLRGQGCWKCNQSHIEELVESILNRNNIDYIPQYRNSILLGGKSLDFFIPSKNIAIECQGIQHFKSIEFFGGDKTLHETIERDVEKYETLSNSNIKIIYVFPKKFIKEIKDEKFKSIYENNVLFQEDIEKTDKNLIDILS